MMNFFRDEGENQENIDVLMLFIAVLSLSKLSVKQIIKTLSRSEALPRNFTKIFANAAALMERWNYGVSEAIELIGSRMKKQKLKSLFTRIQHSFKAGVSLEDFARIEFGKHRAEQENDFEKALEKLRRLVEAYTTLISIVSLLTVSFLLVSTILGGARAAFLETALASVVATLGSTTLLFITNHLRRPIFGKHHLKPRKLQTLLQTAPYILMASVAVVLSAPLLFSNGMTVSQASTILVAAGLLSLMHGYLGRRWHKKINQTENMLPIFLKSFGDYLSATGSIKSAVHMLTLSDFGPLNERIKKLEIRLNAGIAQIISLKTFGLETYGRLGEKTFTLLGEMLEAGARPSQACSYLSDYVAGNLMNDKRREQISSTLKTLSIPLHATLAAIFALLTSLLSILSQIAKLLESYVMLIKPIDTAVVVTYFYTVIAVTSLITTINIYLADGDSVFTLTYFFGITLVISGLCYAAMAAVSGQLLSSFIGLTQNIQSITPR